MNNTVLDRIETVYRRCNSIGKGRSMSAEDWLAVVAPALALAAHPLTGLPEKFAAPATLFCVLAVLTIVRSRPEKLKRLAWIGAGCLTFYALLEYWG